MPLAEVRVWGRLVKFSHTVFALPFAVAMFIVVSKQREVSVQQFLLILLALVCARTAAMAFNRIVDADVDARNPRTQEREIPRGVLSKLSVITLVVGASIGFFCAAWMLGTHCLVLAPVVLAWLFFYSWTKRFSSASHFVLGVGLAMAPGGVWYALTAEVALLPVILMLAVVVWVAGFDILYSCQDVDFDTREGLYSVPVLLGVKGALWLARGLHVGAVVCLAWFGVSAGLGFAYWIALGVFALLLAEQHSIVHPNDLSRADSAFFTRNGLASVLLFLGVLLDALM